MSRGLLVPMLSQTDPNKLPDLLRAHLELADCKRPRLFKRSAAERQVVFR